MSDVKKFPPGFYWGAATASYQVEGGIENTDWAKAAREGRVPVAGRACDHYHRYEEDFDIAKELGHNAHRFSIEWARIEPEEGKFDEAEIEHYRDVLKALRARGIEPFITLWHFTLPLWFSESGGFERKDSPEIFARYCAFVVERLGDLCTHFATMNEPMVFANNGWMRGDWPPFKHDHFVDSFAIVGYDEHKHEQGEWKAPFVFLKVRKNLIEAHNRAYALCKKCSQNTEVGIVKHVILYHSNKNPLNRMVAAFMNWHWTHFFMKRVHKQCDSIGLNYYIHKKYGDARTYDKTDMGWDVYPEGICDALLILKRYNKPVYISEAGVADAADRIRADYIKTQVRCAHFALEQGIDIRGHMYWSLLDNYEWAFGYDKRFGLVEIDYETLERKIRPSAYVYREIIKDNGIVD